MSTSESYDNWASVYDTGIDYEAEIVSDRLTDAGITNVILNKRDHAFHVNWGDLAQIQVLVPEESKAEAAALLASQPFTDKELTDAAMAADPVDDDIPEVDEDEEA